MIVVDTSALIAIMRKEPERNRFVAAIRADEAPLISVVSILEATMVSTRALERGASDVVNEFVADLALRPAPVTLEQIHIAQRAFFDYGKGQGGRPQLNFGDCLVYALTKWAGARLLFKGDDFSHTDIATVS
jgi:ribonuclease VapC